MELCTDGKNEGLFKFVEDWKSHITENHNQVYLVCGSYYFIGEVQSFLRTSS
jgi:folylpolyglutamate synthase/dihydropteroate synthase